MGLKSFFFSRKPQAKHVGSHSPPRLSSALQNAHHPIPGVGHWIGSETEAALYQCLFDIVMDQTDGSAYILGKEAVPRDERVWNVVFLLLSNATLAGILREEGTDVDPAKVALAISQGYVLAHVGTEERKRIAERAIFVQREILQNDSETVRLWLDNVVQGLVSYATTGDRKILRGLTDLCGFMRYTVYPGFIGGWDEASRASSAVSGRSSMTGTAAGHRLPLEENFLRKLRERGGKSEIKDKRWDFSSEEKGYLDLVTSICTVTGAWREAMLHPETATPTDAEWEISLAILPFLWWHDMQPAQADMLNLGRMAVTYGEWICNTLQTGDIKRILDNSLKKAMLLRDHEEADVQRWVLQYTAAALAYLESENAAPILKEMRNIFRHQVVPFVSIPE